MDELFVSSQELSSSPPSSSSLSEHKPIPATQSKVHNLARRYSAMAKQNAQGGTTLSTPASSKPGGPGKVSSLLNKYKTGGSDAAKTASPSTTSTTTTEAAATTKADEHMISDKTVEEEIESDLQVMDPSTSGYDDLAEDDEEEQEQEEEEKEHPTAAAASTKELHSDLVDVPLTKADDAEEHQDDVQVQQKEEEKKEEEPITDQVPELEQALKEVDISTKENTEDDKEEEHTPAPVSEPSPANKPSDEATDKPAQTIEKTNNDADQA
ncbi:hypothetical protein DFQ26_003440 [Actinomortierella ambigua]|nr:hypothetical protein DFQ26_003440 [Actinomortierella ambigua]